MIALQSMFPVAVAAIATTLSLNLPARAQNAATLPRALIGGSVRENISPSELPTNVAGSILERAAIDSGLSISLLQIALAQRILWNDGCMGIYTPNTGCTRAFVPGWRALVTSDRQQWVYHSTAVEAWRSPESSVLPADCFQRLPIPDCRNLPGFSQTNPILPDRTEGGWFVFGNVPSRNWYDPPTDYGFHYVMTGDSLFTHILNFPVGIDGDELFNVSVGDRVLGQFSVGQEVNFLSLLGYGVSEFTITGINAAIDPTSPVAFPIRLAFNTPTAGFKMRAISPPESIPEPSSAIAFLGLGAIGVFARSKYSTTRQID